MRILAAVLIVCGAAAAAETEAETARAIVALERQAMEAWLKGDFAPALAALDPGVTYFHVVSEKRLEGVAALKSLFEGYGGRPLFDSYEIVEPKVQTAGEAAVLTYQLLTRNGDVTRRWNATQVYQKKKEGWRIIHSHFSQAQAQPQR